MASADEFFHQLNLSKSSEARKLDNKADGNLAARKNPMTRYAHQALINSRKRKTETTEEEKEKKDARPNTGQTRAKTKKDRTVQKKIIRTGIVLPENESHSDEVDGHSRTRHQCDICGFDTTSKSEYEDHIQSIKHIVKVEVEKGSDHEILKLEKAWKANFRLPYECTVNSCNAQFIDWRGTLRHIREHNNSFPFSCNRCDSKFRDRGDLARHIKRHLGVKTLKCELCDKRFEKKYSLELHMVKAHGKKDTRAKNFKCTECGEAFFSKKGVDRHLSTHTGYRPEVCETCGASFHTSYDLKDHMRIHSGEKPFTCDQCDFSTRTAQLLNRHKKKHQSEMPYSCKECAFSCNSSRSLKRHSYLHSGKKRYKCPYCEHRCNDLENLKKHIKKNKSHKGFNVYPCTRCNFFTDVGNDYLSHMKQFHFPHLDLKSTTAAKVSGILVEDNPVEESEDDVAQLQRNSIFENESILRDADLPPDSIGLNAVHPTPSTLPELGFEALSDLRKFDANLLNSVNRYDKGDFLLSSAASQETQVSRRPAAFSGALVYQSLLETSRKQFFTMQDVTTGHNLEDVFHSIK